MSAVSRELTPEIRRKLGLPAADERPYRWAFAALVVAVFVPPILLAGQRWLAVLVAFIGLAGIPGVRALERRDRKRRERIYTDGAEAMGRIVAIEPGGEKNADPLVLVEFWTDAGKVDARVRGCRLARQGLKPDDDVRVLYDPTDPTRCLVVERARREIVDAI